MADFGIWLDHRRACLVRCHQGKVAHQWVPFQIDSKKRAAGRSRGVGKRSAHEVLTSDTQLLRRRKLQEKHAYEHLLPLLKEVERLWIFGPGGAKHELKKILQKHSAFRRVVVETAAADEMTERQIIAKVRRRFAVAATPMAAA